MSVKSEIAVCVITYLRPVGLARLLDSLGGLRFEKYPAASFRFVVVDNDEQGSARAVVDEWARSVEMDVTYAFESRRGIPFARNRAVSLAAGSKYVAFIDDDEVADPAWLDELLYAMDRFRADIVAGPVMPIFESSVPEWIREGRFFEKQRGATGTPLKWASTSNILFKYSELTKVTGPFDERLALTGGTDYLLTTQLARSGSLIVWCAEAVVLEYIPASRASLGWILRRGYRNGTTAAITARTQPGLGWEGSWALKMGGKRFIKAAIRLPQSFAKGRVSMVRTLIEAATGAGMILGSLGVRYEEYRRIHGS